jgi:hypothetical protein
LSKAARFLRARLVLSAVEWIDTLSALLLGTDERAPECFFLVSKHRLGFATPRHG